jgi:SWI/SNF-related matrix-associated actin-dependent regulator 1 of chromatin subfamily A
VLVPRPYQHEGSDFLAAHRHALLADEMRVGKTPQAIMACAKVNARRVLVNCPAIAVTHWQREFPRWWGAIDCGQGDLPERLIVSYDRARMDATQIRAENWNVFIPDEAHFAKNPEAMRTKLVYGKEGFGWKSDYLWALSGTPAPKHAGELWPMLRAFGVVGMTYTEFVRRYCRIDYLSQRPIGTREEHIPELKALLAKVMLRRTRKQVAPDMPEIGFDFLEIAQPSKIDYAIPSGMSDEGLVTWLEGQRNANKEDRIDVAMAKVGPLGDEIDFALSNGLLKQTVVFGWHVEPLVKMTSSLRARGYRVETITGATSQSERDRIQREFREGTVDVVDAQILAAGTAIDLSAARHGYFLELDWVPGNNSQAANRLISMEKMDPVTIDVVTWPKSFDSKIQKVLLQRVQELSKLY